MNAVVPARTRQHRPMVPALVVAVLTAAVSVPLAGVAKADGASFACNNGMTYTPTAGQTVTLTGTCSMTGTLPAGATVLLDAANVTAASGSGNAGTIEFVNGLNSSLVTAPGGLFTNTGSIIDTSPDHRQAVYAGHFVNSGTVEAAANSQGLHFDDESTSNAGGVLENAAGGTLKADPGSSFSIEARITATLDAGSTVTAAAGANLAVSQTTLDAAGGNVSGAINAFGDTFTFEASAASSSGTIAAVSGCALSGTIPKGWSFTLSAATLAAADGSGNAGTITFKDGLNSGIVGPAGGTFTNSGSIVDTSPDHRQALFAGHFVNTGSLSTTSGGVFVFDGEQGSAPGKLENAGGGSISVAAPGDLEVDAPIGLQLDSGSTVSVAGGGAFHVSQTLLDAAGGSVNGVLTAFGSQLTFESSATSSTGAITASSDGGLSGTVPAGWSISLTGGSLRAAAGAANAGTITFVSGNPSFTATGGFTNSGHLVAAFGGTTGFTAAPLSNTGTIAVTGSGVLHVAGSLTLSASSTVSVNVAGHTAGSYGSVTVDGAAALAGTLVASRDPAYAPAIGDTQTVLTAGARSGAFSSLAGGNGSDFYTVAYAPTTVTLVTAKPAAPKPAAPKPAAETGLLRLGTPATLLAATVTRTTKLTVAGKAGVPRSGAAAAVVLVTTTTPVTIDGVRVTGSSLLTVPVTRMTVSARGAKVRITVLGYYAKSAGTSGEQFHKAGTTLRTQKALASYHPGHGAVAVLLKVVSPVALRLGGVALPASRSGQTVVVRLTRGGVSGTLPPKATVTILAYLAPLTSSTTGQHRQPSTTKAGLLSRVLP